MISVCYHPTKIVLVDDNKSFLDSMEIQLSDRFSCYFFQDPQKALYHLNNHYQVEPFFTRFISDEKEASQDFLNFDLRKIKQEIYNPNRFDEVMVLVIDYSMPSMNGLEFFRQLRHKSMMRILLTGEASNELALEAFNEDLIDKFIPKTIPRMTEVLIEAIEDLQKKQFVKLSDMLFNTSSQANIPILNVLEDRTFAKVFEKTIEEKKIVEYYLLANRGSFLLLDQQANPSSFVLANDEEMDAYIALAEKGQAPQWIIDRLKNRTHIPYFTKQAASEVPVADWATYIYPAELLEGKERYYYAYIADPSICDIEPERVMSYQKYLQSQEPSDVKLAKL